MGLRSLSVHATHVITCPWDSTDPKTEFLVADCLPLGIRSELKDNFSTWERASGAQTVTTKMRSAARNVEIVRHGLKGLKDFTRADGKPFVLNLIQKGAFTEVPDEALQELAIPLMQEGYDTVIDWLADEIWKASKLQKAEADSFPSQSE
jgi:hypothetical protein